MVLFKTITAFGYTIFFALFSLPFGLLAFSLRFFGLKKPMSWVVYRIGQFWAASIIRITGCTMEIKGRENIPRKGGLCFVSNHAGLFDIILALAYAGRPFGFIAKKELFLLPFFNIWILILGGLFIDRNNIRKALKTIKKGIQKIQNGEVMMIFPEGTRSKGRGLLPFRSGAVKLATNSLAPIVPMAITGSYDVFEKDYRVHAVPVRMVFCPPIITAEISPDDRKHHLVNQVRSVIEAALGDKP
jgi:1-acyl-sn-glycerol-3-phosphate acyltransferase